MNSENLIPKDLSKEPNHRELSKKGGQSTSPKKQFASIVNGHLANKDLTSEQAHMIALLKDNNILELLKELIGKSIIDIDNPSRRDKLIEQLTKLIPQKVINLDISSGEQIRLENGKSVSKDLYEIIKEDVLKKESVKFQEFLQNVRNLNK